MPEPLKPCPFCGGKATFKTSQCSEDTMETWVKCTECNACSDAYEYPYADYSVAELWNERKGE